MSNDFAIRLKGVAKMYRVYEKRADRLVDALGVARLMRPSKRPVAREFWALREIDFELRRGERLGVVGRNGAGKSTMLKLITQNVAPTEGRVEVSGSIQALLTAGAGFHPEFTGEENIRAALVYQGMAAREIDDAVQEIAEFTELGDFLFQSFRTYSAGMQARLSFATATATRPETLIVDEMLSAGDAYFTGRATERMQSLVDSGAAVLIVSHSLDHITMFCDEAIWLDRGRIVMRGPSLDVVKAYDRFTRRIEERRIQARNRSGHAGGAAAAADETVTIRLTADEPTGGYDLSLVELRERNEAVDTLRVGDAQDGDRGHSAFVALENGDWSPPRQDGDRRFRSLIERPGGTSMGAVVFQIPAPDPAVPLELAMNLRTAPTGGMTIEVFRDDELIRRRRVESTDGAWAKAAIDMRAMFHVGGGQVTKDDFSEGASHWPGEGSLRIEDVKLEDGEGTEKALFSPGERLVLRATVRATCDGSFPLTSATSLFRLDGLLISTNISDEQTVDVKEGDSLTLLVDFGALNLNKGKYVFSLALYRKLDPMEPERYDLVDRSYEFEVWDNEPFRTGVFVHPVTWSLDAG